MDINRLLSDELSFELFVRNLPTGGTVADKRVLLRNAIRVEKSGFMPSYAPVQFDLISELGTCTEKLESLASDIQKFDSNNKENEYKRIYSRLIHLNNRITKISVRDNQHITSDLNMRCLLLLEDLSVLYSRSQIGVPSEGNPEILNRENETIGSIIDDPNPLLPQTGETNNNISQRVQSNRENVDPIDDLISFVRQPQPKVSFTNQININSEPCSASNDLDKNQPARSESNVRSPEHLCSSLDADSHGPPLSHRVSRQSSPNHSVAKISNQFPSQKIDFGNWPSSHPLCSQSTMHPDNLDRPLNVSSWNLNFNGESGSVIEFLQRVEEYRLSRGVSKDRLFRAAPELLRGTALNWFRSENVNSWDELVQKLKEYFLPYDYEFSLNEEIRKRSQGSHEKVIVYIASMQNLFNRLNNKPDEETRVIWIRRNLRPYIQNALALQTIKTVEQLTKFCRSIEETSLRAEQYCPPSTNYRSLLEPQLAYRKPSGIPQTSAVSERAHTFMNATPVASVETPQGRRSCWNCGTSGHNFRVCTAPRRKFCFKCGFRNVVVKDCPKCQGNGLSESRRTDV